MIIRKAHAADCTALIQLEHVLFSPENYPLSQAAFYYHIKSSLLRVIQADNGEIVGYALALVKRRRKAKLYSIGISEILRGSTMATQLLNTMLKELSKMGFTKTQLEVRVDNQRAVSFYQREGFIIISQSEHFYKDGCDAYIMEKDYGY